jgi:hypothetical protein
VHLHRTRAVQIITDMQHEFVSLNIGLCSWLRLSATSRNITGSIPSEVIGYLNWPNPFSSGFDSAPDNNEYHQDKGWPARKADNLTAIYEPIVYKT